MKKALLFGGAAAVGLAAAKKKKFHELSQLSDDEIRAKVKDRLGDRVDDETAAEMADHFVSRIRSRGTGPRRHHGHHRHTGPRRSRRDRGARWEQKMEELAELSDDEVRAKATRRFSGWLDEEDAAEMAKRFLARLRRRHPSPEAS